jgi:Mrp family chromosome partitioning ATPase
LQNTPHSHQKNANSKKRAIAGVKQILAVAANKGGVGKSTIACNLAIKLANKGYKIALVDADIYGPSVPHLMKLENKKPEIINNLIKPLNAFGVKVMSIGFIVNESSAGIWRGPMVTKILFQLFHQVLWVENQEEEIDLMIIDMPPGTGDVYLSIGESLAIDGMMLVSTPQQLAVSDLKKSIDCCHKLEIPIVGIVENMSFLPVIKKISWLQKFLSTIFCSIKYNFLDGKIKNNISKKYHIKKEYIFGKNCLKNLAKDNNINVIAELPISQILQDVNKINSNHNKENKIIINTLFDKIIKYLENNLIKVKK